MSAFSCMRYLVIGLLFSEKESESCHYVSYYLMPSDLSSNPGPSLAAGPASVHRMAEGGGSSEAHSKQRPASVSAGSLQSILQGSLVGSLYIFKNPISSGELL